VVNWPISKCYVLTDISSNVLVLLVGSPHVKLFVRFTYCCWHVRNDMDFSGTDDACLLFL